MTKDEAINILASGKWESSLICVYCNDTDGQANLFEENNYAPYSGMESTVSIEENNGKHRIEIDIWAGGNVYAAFEINFCPMCGRKLESE